MMSIGSDCDESMLTTTSYPFTTKMSASMLTDETKIRVSSVLNRNVKQFGKSFLTDGEVDTCWNSDQGSPQWILVNFGREVKVTELHLQFQGGFVGTDCWVETGDSVEHLTKSDTFYSEDVNCLQVFPFGNLPSAQVIKVVFNSSTDFYGRVTVYKLDIRGEPS